MRVTLYRKYRPQDFDEVVGQRVAVNSLKNALKSGQWSHAYLFAGPRGCGKTTIARIFAKAVNCRNRRKGV
ncbi:MAG: AAA family ATPase, partial [bacterium]